MPKKPTIHRKIKTKLNNGSLDENGLQLKTIFENSYDAIGISKNGIMLQVNGAYCSTFGYESEKAMIGIHVLDLIIASERDRISDYVAKRFSNDDAPNFYETVGLKKNKEEFPCEIKIASYLFKKERYTVAIIRDITKRKLAERALQQSEEKYLKIFDRAPVLISTTDFETGIFTTVNSYSLTFSGFTKDEVLGKTSADLGWITLEDRKLLIDTITTHGKIEGLEMAFKTKSGNIVHGIVNGEKITIDNKQYLLTIAVDITARKKAELALFDAKIKAEESEKRFANAIAATSDAIWELNLQTGQAISSPLYHEMLGYDVNDFKMSFESWKKLCHADDFESANDKISNAIANSTSYAVEFRMQKKDGQWIWVLGRGKVVQYDEQGKPLLLSGTNTDITERRQLGFELEKHRNHLEKLVSEKTDEIATANEELRATNDILFDKNEIIQAQNLELNKTLEYLKETQTQLVQTEKLASLGVLTAGVAHEINNPLNYIMGAYEGLSVVLKQTEQINDTDVQKLLDSLKSGVDRVSKIVKGLNQFSRNTEQLNEQCDIAAIIENCLTILKKEYKDRIQINTQFPNVPIIINGNVGKLHQVFTNVIGNAIQAIKKNGTIQITVSKDSSNVLIEISDTGCGIPEENLNKILEPFFTTKDPGKGTGIGLSISYSIIKEHGGALKFESKVNEGTTVRIGLPLKINSK